MSCYACANDVHFIGSNGVVTRARAYVCVYCDAQQPSIHPLNVCIPIQTEHQSNARESRIVHRRRERPKQSEKEKRSEPKKEEKKTPNNNMFDVRVVYARAHVIMFMPHRITNNAYMRPRHGHKRHDGDGNDDGRARMLFACRNLHAAAAPAAGERFLYFIFSLLL